MLDVKNLYCHNSISRSQHRRNGSLSLCYVNIHCYKKTNQYRQGINSFENADQVNWLNVRMLVLSAYAIMDYMTNVLPDTLLVSESKWITSISPGNWKTLIVILYIVTTYITTASLTVVCRSDMHTAKLTQGNLRSPAQYLHSTAIEICIIHRKTV